MAQIGESGIEYVYETDATTGLDHELSSDRDQDASSQNVSNREESLINRKPKDNPFSQLPEYEIASTGGPEETLDQKLQKLWIEIVEFQEEENIAKEKAKSEVSSQKAVSESGELLKKLDLLKGLIGNVGCKINLTDPQGTLHKKLLADIEKFKGKKPDDEKTEDAKIDYQLFFPTKDSKLDRLSKVSALEKRLACLDQVMGRVLEIPTPLVVEAANKSLLEIVSSLVTKSKALESQNWNDVENKAGSVLKRMDQVAEKRDIMEQKAKMDKISELYHIMLKWQKLSSMLPQVADRLQTLKTLHEQSLEFKQLLGHLEVTQQQIGIQLKGHSELLKSVQGDIVKNLAVMKKNCENIDNKFRSVK